MKKRLISALLITAMAATMVAGCGKKSEESKDGKVHIQFMHMQVEQERQDAVQALIDKFQEANPDVKAIIDSLTELEKTAEETGTYLYLEPLNRYQDHI